MTRARADQDAAFKNCCLRSGRYDGANRNHFFPRIVSKQFLRAEELGLSLEMTNPTFTNLSAVSIKSIVPGVGGTHIERKTIMAINYAKLFNRRVTPQSQPIPGSTQVRNSNSGYSWQVDDWTRLDRFLILGAEGGTYYIGERELVKQNHDALIRCIKAGRRSCREPHR